MVPGLTSVVIPTYNHAEYLEDAIVSALWQRPAEVIVVDDGSTDGTDAVLGSFRDQIRVIRLPHGGPSKARNAGIEAARGEFLMFLDADDVIAHDKIAKQLAAFSDEVGWVLCDTRIEDDVRKRVELASERYRYAQRDLGGWIRDQLAASNFIPIHAPLIRRSVLTDDVRFGDKHPEDWHFWYRLASHARVRYIPDVLCTYRKRRGSRNTLGIPETKPGDPVLLNLGCGTPGALSWHPMPGCVNLDRSMGWCFEDGLPQYADGTVDGITVSHALMYIDERDWPKVFAEFARVLKPGGVLRVTEDVTDDPASSRFGGWKGSEPAVTLTSRPFVRAAMLTAGLCPVNVDADTTRYRDRSLIQAQHGAPPDVFFVEGVKP